MNPARLLRLAWPDVLERVRRSSFLLTVGTTMWLGSLVYTNNIQMWVGTHRGVVNSAWLGTLMALSATTFVSLVGFYVVKNAVERDRQTGVGQILAATRVSTREYLLAKWLSNFTVLASVVVTLAAAAVILHVFRAEAVRFDAIALLTPLLLLALPAMAVVAAFAVLFETVPWLSGGAGNVAYFFAWNAALTIPLVTGTRWADWSGISFVESSLAAAVHAQAPGAPATISFTAGPARDLSQMAAIDWAGIHWTANAIGLRLAWFAVSAIVVLCASAWFDRFDAAASPRARRPTPSPVTEARPRRRRWSISRAFSARVWALIEWVVSARTTFGGMVLAELRLAFSEVGTWWMLVAVGLWVASLAVPLQAGRYVHGVAWLWPLLLWSKMGVRETQHRTAPLVFSCPHPLRRQFAALWVTGVLVAIATGAGIAVRFGLAGDMVSLAAWAAGAVFIPSIALALGVWTGSPRAFEALFTAWWYVGPASRVASLDYSGAWATDSALPNAAVYGALAAILLATAVVGRRRRIEG